MEPRWRVSPQTYKFLLTGHIFFSALWLGIVVAKLVLGVSATFAHRPRVTEALLVSMDALNIAFPPLAVGTFVSGVVLSLGTRWGLLVHYWVATKLLLTIIAIATAVQSDLLGRALKALSGSAFGNGVRLNGGSETTLLIYLSASHFLMLGIATVFSVYKPFGKIRFGKS